MGKTGFHEWKRARMGKRNPRQRWTQRQVRDLLHLFREAEAADTHIEIVGYVECNECYASTPLDDVLDKTGLHLERMVHGENAKDKHCFQDRRFSGLSEIDKKLLEKADELEPHTHCCECTPGKHFQRHEVHIQYPECECDPKNYVLKKNEAT